MIQFASSVSHKKQSMQGEDDNRTVVCFLQPNFISTLKTGDEHGFSVKALDNNDTLHVCVEGGDKTEPEWQVVFKVFKELPKTVDHAENEACSLIRTLPALDEPQIAILVSEDDHVLVYTRLKAKDPLKRAQVLRQPRKSELYSRSRGILESSLLEPRKVAVIGLGSGGSHVVLELAKAGIGKFVLVDYDRIELHNIIRHVCDLNDLGRLKTNAIRDRILNKNPFAEIELHNTNINNLEQARTILQGCDLVIAATDNIRSRLNINTLSIELGIPVIYGKCAVRAAGGEVLRVRPKNGPCFSCIYADASNEAISEEISSFRQAREANPPYVGDDEVQAQIQVGLSSDIVPIANFVVKLALVELCRGQDSALASLEQDLVASFYMWGNRRDQQFASFPQDGFQRFDRPAVLRWYPMERERNPDCKACQDFHADADNVAFFFS